jgi:AraC-like DNA-binding protein
LDVFRSESAYRRSSRLSGPFAYVFEARGTQHVDYAGTDCHVHELWHGGSGWHHIDLTDVTGAPELAGTRISAPTRTLANRLQDELRWSDACTRVSVEGLALELAAAVSREQSRREPKVLAWLWRVREYLEVHYRKCPELGLVAGLVGVHPVHLIRVFRQHYKCTPGHFLRQRRLESAADALAQSEQPLLEIALEAGFADQPHFTKAFRKFSGQTPSEYRRARRGAKR